MRKIHLALILAVSLVAQSAMANETDNKSCGKIAKACKAAGFSKEGDGEGKGKKAFWVSCMLPVLKNQTVKGVTVDADTIKDCRTAKIEEMKAKLQDLESVSDKS